MATKTEHQTEVTPDVAALLAEFRAEREANRIEREALVALLAQRSVAPAIVTDEQRAIAGQAEIERRRNTPSPFDLYSAPLSWRADGVDASCDDGSPRIALHATAWFVDKHNGRGLHCFKLDRMAETPEFRERCMIETMKDQGSLPQYRAALANPLDAAVAAALASQASPLAKDRMRRHGSLPCTLALVSTLHPSHIYITPAIARRKCLTMGKLVDANGVECNDLGEPIATAADAAAE